MRYPLETNTGADTVVFTHEKYRTNRSQEDSAQQAGPPGEGSSGDIILYMPNSTAPMANGQDWGSKGFEGPLGRFRSDVAMTGAQILNDASVSSFTSEEGLRALGNDVGSGLASITNSAFENGGGIIRQMGTSALAKLGTYESASQLLAMQRGQIFNPNVELLYRGTGLRSFSFSYTFVPKSEQEAQQVNSIIMEFKTWSSPADLENGMFEVPHVWNVRYMSNGAPNPNMNVFKKAALTSVNVQHNPGLDMHATFPNGMPIITALTLSFQEVDIIVRQDHENAGNNIGF